MKQKERLLFGAAALMSIITVVILCIFIIKGGATAIAKIGILKFIFGTKWKPELDEFGILPQIISSAIVTVGAVAVGVPIGILYAIYLKHYCPKCFKSVATGLIDLLSSIPSVVYGFCALSTVVPMIAFITGESGSCLFSGIIVLSVMILPTVTVTSYSALNQVSSDLLTSSLALGAAKERCILCVEMKAAQSGILLGVMLAVGRAIGETMAVIMVLGNQPILPRGLFKGARTLTANIALEMGYATGLHRDALIATGLVLFIITMILNLLMIKTKDTTK